MKKIMFTLLALGAVSMSSIAQRSTEFGYNMGFSAYLGDLQPSQYTYSQASYSTGLFVRHNINSFVGFRGFFNYGRLQAHDANSGDQGQIYRNLSFRSTIAEMGAVIDINFMPFDKFNPANKKFRKYFNFTPYVFGGLNAFYFNPKTFYKSQWVALQPLRTEGQTYSLTQIAIPFGMGFRWQVNKHIGFGIEFGCRKTFTDYLDDVSGSYPDLTKMAATNSLAAELSYRGDEVDENPNPIPGPGAQRGLSTNMDWYLINNISFTYKICHKDTRAKY